MNFYYTDLLNAKSYFDDTKCNDLLNHKINKFDKVIYLDKLSFENIKMDVSQLSLMHDGYYLISLKNIEDFNDYFICMVKNKNISRIEFDLCQINNIDAMINIESDKHIFVYDKIVDEVIEMNEDEDVSFFLALNDIDSLKTFNHGKLYENIKILRIEAIKDLIDKQYNNLLENENDIEIE